jgi:hypothetical protein
MLGSPRGGDFEAPSAGAAPSAGPSYDEGTGGGFGEPEEDDIPF